MKDTVGPTAIGLGTSMQLSPAIILQLVGLVIAIWGGFYTRKRFIESKRANDIAEKRLNWDMSNGTNKSETTSKTESEEGP